LTSPKRTSACIRSDGTTGLAVIDPPRGIHVAVGFDQLLAGKTFVGLTGFLAIAFGYSGRLRVSLGGGHPVPLDASVQDAFAL
jgi:hypothetical protein